MLKVVLLFCFSLYLWHYQLIKEIYDKYKIHYISEIKKNVYSKYQPSQVLKVDETTSRRKVKGKSIIYLVGFLGT